MCARKKCSGCSALAGKRHHNTKAHVLALWAASRNLDIELPHFLDKNPLPFLGYKMGGGSYARRYRGKARRRDLKACHRDLQFLRGLLGSFARRLAANGNPGSPPLKALGTKAKKGPENASALLDPPRCWLITCRRIARLCGRFRRHLLHTRLPPWFQRTRA